MGILNDRIKEMRDKRGLTLLQLAKKLGVKEATMQRYESGEIKNIKHDTIVALADIFHCTPAYLMGWEEYDAPANTGEAFALSSDKDYADLPPEAIREIETFKQFVREKYKKK